MRRHVVSLLSLGLLSLGLLSTALGVEAAPEAIPETKDAKSQEESWKLAKMQDLPAIAKADKVTITDSQTKVAIEVTDATALKAIRGSLTITDGPPSAGEDAYVLTFYRGKEKVRSLWVFDYGEWGVQRPKTSYTCGTSDTLVKAIQNALKTP